MKRVIVVSDSHGMEDRLRQVLHQAFSLGPVDVLVFLGDGLAEWERVSQEFLYGRPSLRLYAVKGNNDYGWDAPLTQVIAVGKAKLLLCHGHTFHVKNGLYHLEFEAADQDVQAALFGHTHLGHLEYANGCLFLNPGAVSQLRPQSSRLCRASRLRRRFSPCISTAGLKPCTHFCAHSAQRRSGTCGLAGVLPPWHDRCHGSPAWQGFALRPSLRAMRAGHSGDMRLGRGFTAVARQVPRLAGLAGLCPAPLTARYARRALWGHAAWPGFYRRGTTGATARRSGRALPCTHFCAHSAQVARGHAAWPGFYRRGTTGATARQSGRASCRLTPGSRPMFYKTLPHFPVLMRLIRGAIVDFRQAFHQNRGFAHESLYLSGQRRHHGGQAGSSFQNATLLHGKGGQSQFHPLRRAGDSQSGGERPAAGGRGASCRSPGNLLHRRGQRKRQLGHPLRCSRDGQKARHYLRRRASRGAAQSAARWNGTAFASPICRWTKTVWFPRTTFAGR